MKEVQTVARRLVDNVKKVIIGKEAELEMIVVGLLAQGHMLIEDVPGVGKTMLAKSLARSIGCTFKRIQFTPDMLPSDVTGVSVFNQKTREFEFRPGPIHAQIVVTDEINRATPKTQSALLEAMEERQVTVDGTTYPMAQPFLVLATQNPIEYEGTFPLPEAQLDRFLLRISLGYPEKDDEIRVLESQQYRHPVDTLEQVLSVEELLTAQEQIKEVYVDPLIKSYVVEMVRQSRRHPDVYLGASPRGSLALYRTGRAHRVIIGPAARIKDVSARSVIEEIVRGLPVPGAQVSSR
jgi:MoxR-like ATPase